MTPDRDAHSIPEFCASHGISRASYYNLEPDDRPREMRVGTEAYVRLINALNRTFVNIGLQRRAKDITPTGLRARLGLE